MIPARFAYERPTSIDDAIRLLQEGGDDAKLLAGGHSLLPLMKLRLAAPGLLIDLGAIPDLAYMRTTDGQVAIGAMTTHDAVAESTLLQDALPLLTQVAGTIGDTQVRNRGTIGGSLAHADPAADFPAVAVALSATMVARGPNGEREIPAANFFQDIWTSALEPEEVLTEVRFPLVQGSGAYQKFRQRASDWAIAGAAVWLETDGGLIRRASVVLTNMGPTPMRAKAVEAALADSRLDENILPAAEQAADGLDPTPELKASAEYKRHLARVLTRRALADAVTRAGA
jgi:aerobic carbon-monoxide dehydrogenase medium subunit